MKKVLIITYYWPPSGGAGVQRVLKFVKYLPEFDILPYVVTVDESKASYPFIDTTFNKDIPSEAKIFRTDTFEPFDIYSKLLGKKSIPTGFSNESDPGLFQKFSRFVRGNFFIPDARRGWIKFAVDKAVKIIEEENIDTVITTSPPHSAQIAGLRLKEKFNLKWIADLRDPWTDIHYYNEFHHLAFAKTIDQKYEREVLEKADAIITVSNDLKKLFLKKSPAISDSKIFIIPNGYDDKDFNTVSSAQYAGEDFIITYTGTIADSYNPGVFFKALKKLTGVFPEINFKLRFIGNYASSVIEKAKQISLSSNLELIPALSHDESIAYLLKSTVLLLLIPEVKKDKGIITGKLFEYLASGKPIICIGPPDGDAAEIISECKSGKTFNRNMEEELSEYLDMLVKNWKSGQRPEFNNENYKKYSRRSQAQRLSEIIKS